jgi:hypothetical protein
MIRKSIVVINKNCLSLFTSKRVKWEISGLERREKQQWSEKIGRRIKDFNYYFFGAFYHFNHPSRPDLFHLHIRLHPSVRGLQTFLFPLLIGVLMKLFNRPVWSFGVETIISGPRKQSSSRTEKRIGGIFKESSSSSSFVFSFVRKWIGFLFSFAFFWHSHR